MSNIKLYGNSLNKSESVTNPWQYACGYLDATTGLYKFGTRYYDPQAGRWTQKDSVGGSVGKIGSGNPYMYADNVPNMQVDPSGRSCTVIELVGYLLLAISAGGIAAVALSTILPSITGAPSLLAVLGIIFATPGGLIFFFGILGAAGAAIFVGICLVPLLHGED